MANRIRGITVEIGGDTTKLDKALKGTNAQLKATQTDLKDVERLLKLDPGNTELLAQKHRLLADAVNGTREKLDTLQAAAKGADEALTRGKAYEERYAPLKQSLDEVSGELDRLKDKQATMDQSFAEGKISSEQYQKFMKTLQETKEKFDELKAAKSALDEELSGVKLDQRQYDALQREIVETAENLEDLEKKAGRSSAAMDSFGAAADKVSQKADAVSSATRGLSIAAAGVATGIGAMAYKAGLAADDLNTLAAQSGFSTELIQQWRYASDIIDVNVEDIISAARKMEKNMASTSSDVTQAWSRLGISVKDNAGNYRDAEGVFNDLLMGLSMIPNETERDVIAMTLLGKSANDLTGLVDDGGAALRQLGQEAKDAGLILSQEALDGANAFNDQIDRLKANAQAELFAAGANLAESLLPLITSLVDSISGVLSWLAQLNPQVLKTIAVIAMLVAGISPIAGMVAGISNAIFAVSKVAGIFSSGAGEKMYLTFAKWALIITAVVVAVAALIAMINVLMGKGDQVSSTLNAVRGTPQSTGQPGGQPVAAMSGSIPGFASGGVFAPNNPMLGILGDNRTEYEVAAPESTLRELFLDALDSRGITSGNSVGSSPGPLALNMVLDGQTFARLFLPYIKGENVRLGLDILNR